MKTRHIRSTEPRAGIILFAVLASITALALLAGTIAIIATADIRMAAAFKRSVDAFYNTEAGVQYVKSRIESDLAANVLSLSSPTIAVHYTAPTGMTFDTVRQLTQTANTNVYYYTVTGHEPPARCTVEVTFRRNSIFELGLFGDEEFETKAYGSIYMYDSRETTNPVPSDSIGGAVLASNGDFITKQDSFIDGSCQLGATTDGTQGTWTETPTGGSDITGEAALPTERIEPDPLGASGGDLAVDFISYSVTNDNPLAIPPVPNNTNVRIKNGNTVMLPSGNYYIHDLIIDAGCTLDIQATNSPVTIYLTGQLDAKNGSIINTLAEPGQLRIFSNSTDDITLFNDGDFYGMIYAPYSDVQIMNSGDFYGTAWAQTLEIKNSGEVYVDAALMDAFPGRKIRILSWKEVRDS